MSNPFYNASGSPAESSEITSLTMRSEFAAIGAGFDKLPVLTGNAYKIVYVNAAGTALDIIGNAQAAVTFLTTSSSANLAALLTDETGTGAAVFATSPTLVTPVLGTPASGTLTNCTGLPVATGISGLGAAVATFLASPTSANLENAVLNTNTGSGSLVFSNTPTLSSPTFSSPNLGTPSNGTLTFCTIPVGGVTGMGTGVGTFLATPSSANLRAALTDETGTGAAVFATSPTIATPTVSGAPVLSGQTVGTTVGAAGGADALPATPLGYLEISINGTAVKIPYYSV